MPSREYEQVLQVIKRKVTNHPQPIEAMRAEFEINARMFRAAPDIRCEPVRVDHLTAEWTIPQQATTGRVLLYLHGGGYVMGSMNTHREMVSRIARAGEARALLPGYRLAPEHPFPAALEDAVLTYRWLLNQGTDPRQMVVAGDSAGGGLAIAALVNLRDGGSPLPSAVVCLSPWVDLEGLGQSMNTNADLDPIVQREGVLQMALMVLNGKNPRTPLAVPLYADLRGLPPLLIQVGSRETLLDDARRLASRAQEAGVEVVLEVWKGMFHVWHFFASILPEGVESIGHIGRFIENHARSPR